MVTGISCTSEGDGETLRVVELFIISGIAAFDDQRIPRFFALGGFKGEATYISTW
jgi:hypothetical protein